MGKVTICFTYFRSLTLANLRAALHSVRQQDLSRVDEIIVLDNNTDDAESDIVACIEALSFPLPVTVFSQKHGDPSRTHSWSTNAVVGMAKSQWVLFCRADYLLSFDLLHEFLTVADAHPADWDGFVTGDVYHLSTDVGQCEQLEWRRYGPQVLLAHPGAVADYTKIDAGVWLATKRAFDRVQGLDEALTAWGHAQTHFQHKLFTQGTEFVRVPRVFFFHPKHSAPRDIGLAHQQLADRGIDLKQLWQRHEGAQPY